ncbi:MAG TPA: LuxR C-terminal-related transcriptional regulator [Micromonosporaceae bacterium]|nr:LuxR C-terminal-related transcriptional regulator [Micromonosporaceae bacterium]
MNGTAIRLAVQSGRRLVRDALCAYLYGRPEFTVVGQTGGIEALPQLCALRRPDATLVDAGELTMQTVEALVRVRASAPATEIVVAYTEVSTYVLEEAVRAGITSLVSCSRGLDAVLRVVRDRVHPAGRRHPDGLALTEREMEIMSLMGSGHSVPEMAGLLHISPRTVENHKRRLYVKLGVGSSSHAVSRATSLGLLDTASEQSPVRPGGERGRPPLVVVQGPDGAGVDQVSLACLAVQFPFVVTRTAESLAGEHWARWHRGPVVAVLIDPAPDDWLMPSALGVPAIVVHTRGPDLAGLLDALLRGAHALLRVDDVPGDFAAVLSLVVRGYFAMNAAHVEDLADWMATRLADGSPTVPALTTRECDILGSIASGHTVRQTARSLGIAAKTVENTQARLFRKLGARNRPEALTIAYRLGLVDPERALAGTTAS